MKGKLSVFLGLLLIAVVACFEPLHAESRWFTNQDGRKIEATLIAKSDNLARLRTSDGKEYSIEIKTLSEADQEYVRNWVDPKSREAVAKTDLAEVMEARGFVRLDLENQNNHLYAKFTIGGKDVCFILDSGAMTSIISPKAVSKLGLEIRPSDAQVAGIGGGAQIEGETDAKDCCFDGSKTTSIPFLVLAMPGVGREVDGLLGSDFLKAKRALLDYQGSCLWLDLGDS